MNVNPPFSRIWNDPAFVGVSEDARLWKCACFVGEFLIISRGFKFSEREGETVEGSAQERLNLSGGIIRN